MKFKAKVLVYLKKSILDAQGNTTLHALKKIGFAETGRHGLSVQLIQQWLWVECIDMAGAAMHEEKDDTLGFGGEVPSPSFALVIPYAPPSLRLPVWHVDLYRLDDPTEVEELGLDDALSDSVLLIEWPEGLGDRLWPSTLRITLKDDGDGGRRLTVSVPPSWESRCPFQ